MYIGVFRVHVAVLTIMSVPLVPTVNPLITSVVPSDLNNLAIAKVPLASACVSSVIVLNVNTPADTVPRVVPQVRVPSKVPYASVYSLITALSPAVVTIAESLALRSSVDKVIAILRLNHVHQGYVTRPGLSTACTARRCCSSCIKCASK